MAQGLRRRFELKRQHASRVLRLDMSAPHQPPALQSGRLVHAVPSQKVALSLQ